MTKKWRTSNSTSTRYKRTNQKSGPCHLLFDQKGLAVKGIILGLDGTNVGLKEKIYIQESLSFDKKQIKQFNFKYCPLLREPTLFGMIF